MYKQNPNGNCRLCQAGDDRDTMVECTECDRWFHLVCVKLKTAPKLAEVWLCPKCITIKDELNRLNDRAKSFISADVTAQMMKENREQMIIMMEHLMKKNIKNEAGEGSSQGTRSVNNNTDWTIYLKRQALMELPKFNGVAKEWPRFKKTFMETTREGGFSNLENMTRLQQVLQGNALKVVRQLMLDSNNVDSIITRLEEVYGRPEDVYRELLNELISTRKGIVEMSDALENLVSNIEAINREDYLNDPRLIDELIKKLPYALQIKWAEYIQEDPQGKKTLKDLNNWLKPHAKTHRTLNTLNQATKRNFMNFHDKQQLKKKSVDSSYEQKCGNCAGEHTITNCRKFRNMTPEKRNDVAKANKLCFGCLSSYHIITKCKNKRNCNRNGCNMKHHSWLHEDRSAKAARRTDQHKEVEEDKQEDTVNYHQNKENKTFYQVIPVTLENGERKIKTYAFLDAGSSLTLLDNVLAEKLQLEGQVDPLALKWTQDVSRTITKSRRVQLKVNGSSDKSFTLKNVRTIENLQLPMQSLNVDEMKRKFAYLKKVPLQGYNHVRPKLLIGLDHSHLMTPLDHCMGKENEPIAIKTKLGWLMFGNISAGISNEVTLMIHQEDQEMTSMMRNYFSTEEFGVKIVAKLPKSKDDERAEKIMNDTISYKDGRYEIGLIWKYDNISFPESYNNALKRLVYMENKLDKNPILKQWTNNTFTEYQQKGYLRKLTPEEMRQTTPKTFYLPHFLVINPSKSKPRLVFDAAAKINGVSFNSMLLSGSDLTTSLLGVATRFREGGFAVCGDIKEMFHQTRIIKEDQDSQRILWRNCDSTKTPEEYVLQVMTFGATCSPSCAQFTKNKNAELFENVYPEAAKAVVKQHYVDDYLDSFETLDEAEKITKEVMKIHDHAGYFLRNFISNDPRLLSRLPEDRRQEVLIKPFEEKEAQFEKVLGIYWNTRTDSFGFQVKDNVRGRQILENKRPTMREVLSYVMSIYDPLGLIANYSIQGKILMQELHKSMSNWDELIPESLVPLWHSWNQLIKGAEMIKIPRCLINGKVDSVELHVFVDASNKAFATCIYTRSLNDKGMCIRLMAAKARVAPIRGLSIPRLELQAAILGTRLSETMKEEMRLKVSKTFYWSDSQTVLAWINNVDNKAQQFVLHRIGEILDTTTKDQWRWVPTNVNPADEATKLTTGKSIWIDGPEFLRKTENEWPSKSIKQIKETVLMHRELDDYDFIPDARYSSWWKLVKIMCYLIKFTQWIKNKRNFDRNISYDLRLQAENVLYKKAQWESFPEEMEDLIMEKEVKKTSRYKNLNPFLDENGVMRARGRLENASSLPKSMRTPIILPQKHHITRLLVKETHEKYFHQAENTIIGVLQLKYWIINVRAVVKNAKKCCFKCIIANAKPNSPMMAALPNYRTALNVFPFLHTGVDYFGPFEVAVRNSIEKRWGVIFTCLNTRAIHIEMAMKLDTDAFLVCLKDFQGRRGHVSHMYSDRGTNFVGAEHELSRLIKEIDQRMGRYEAAKMRINWHFNPPASPHFGGAWERLISIIKSALKEMLASRNGKRYQSETLRSALIQAEFFVNSRPLTHIPVEDINDEVLTPFHWLIGRSGEYIPPYTLNAKPYSKNQWQLAQNASKGFWDKWKKEYIPTLLKRNKWTEKSTPIKVDDIVLITDDNAPPNAWLKGRVVKVYTAPDGQVRSAEVKTRKGIIKRPAVKIAVLDVQDPTVEEIVPVEAEEIPATVLVYAENKSIKRSHVDKTFPKWGKKRNIEDKKVREAAKELTPKSKSEKKSPNRRISMPSSNLAKAMLTTTLVLSIFGQVTPFNIKPIQDDGIIVDHQGSVLVKRGMWETTIRTDIRPEEDCSQIDLLQQELNRSLTNMQKVTTDMEIDHIVTLIQHECEEAKEEIWQKVRIKRSKGVFSFLVDFLFGGNEYEEEIQAMRLHEDERMNQISETILKINAKATKMGTQLNNRFYQLGQAVDRLKNGIISSSKEIVRIRMMEAVALVKETITEMRNKYRRLTSNPLDNNERLEIMANITRHLPRRYVVLDDLNAVKYDTKMENGTVVVVMTNVIIGSGSFELMKAIPIPHPRNMTILRMENQRIAVNEQGEYFYPSSEMVEFNKTHFITSQLAIISKPDCLASIILHKRTEQKCQLDRVHSPYINVLQLSDPNSVLYYTNNPKEIVIHCEKTVISPPYDAAIVQLQPDCRMSTNNYTIYGKMYGKTRKYLTYFKSRTDIDQVIDGGIPEITVNSKPPPKPSNPYVNDIISIIQRVETPARPTSHYGISIASAAIVLLVVGGSLYYRYKCRLRPQPQPGHQEEAVPSVTYHRSTVPAKEDISTVNEESSAPRTIKIHLPPNIVNNE